MVANVERLCQQIGSTRDQDETPRMLNEVRDLIASAKDNAQKGEDLQKSVGQLVQVVQGHLQAGHQERSTLGAFLSELIRVTKCYSVFLCQSSHEVSHERHQSPTRGSGADAEGPVGWCVTPQLRVFW